MTTRTGNGNSKEMLLLLLHEIGKRWFFDEVRMPWEGFSRILYWIVISLTKRA